MNISIDDLFLLLRLTEKEWVMHGTRLPATREVLMVALQKVERILVRATGKHSFKVRFNGHLI